MIEPRYFDIAIKSAIHSHQSFLDCDIITQRWNWGWKFYCYMPHIGQVHLNLPDNQPGVAVVSDLVVLQHARRQGHGRSLLSLCETLANFLEADALGIWADPEDWPIGWYQRLGFQKRGANPEATPDLYLEKPLETQKRNQSHP